MEITKELYQHENGWGYRLIGYENVFAIMNAKPTWKLTQDYAPHLPGFVWMSQKAADAIADAIIANVTNQLTSQDLETIKTILAKCPSSTSLYTMPNLDTLSLADKLTLETLGKKGSPDLTVEQVQTLLKVK